MKESEDDFSNHSSVNRKIDEIVKNSASNSAIPFVGNTKEKSICKSQIKFNPEPNSIKDHHIDDKIHTTTLEQNHSKKKLFSATKSEYPKKDKKNEFRENFSETSKVKVVEVPYHEIKKTKSKTGCTGTDDCLIQ